MADKTNPRPMKTLSVAIGPKSSVIGEAEDAEKRHERVVHEVEADRCVQPSVGERADPMQNRGRCLGEEPNLFERVLTARRLYRMCETVQPDVAVRQEREEDIDAETEGEAAPLRRRDVGVTNRPGPVVLYGRRIFRTRVLLFRPRWALATHRSP